jgi:outer membrane protein assembly factor BamB
VAWGFSDSGLGYPRPNMPRPPFARMVLGVVVVVILLAACSGGDDGGEAAPDTTAPAPSTTAAPPSTTGAAGGCPPAAASPTPEGPSATLQTLFEGGEGEPRVQAAVYPRPTEDGDPFSQWGQGIVLPDGRFLSGAGDHLGQDGNSWLYAFDPATSTLIQFTDVQSVVGHDPGDWGYGKVHAQMVPGPCGEVYVTTYWGDETDIRFEGSYDGDVLLRIDPATLEVESLGTPVPEHGIPSLAGWEGQVLYGEAVDPTQEEAATFFVYDLRTGEVTFTAEDDNRPWRNVLVRPDGTAYYSAGEGSMFQYDPATGALSPDTVPIPGGVLRASTHPAPDGTVYAATHEPDVLFAVDPSGEVREIGPLRDYTASMALDPSGQYLYYVPDAHGSAYEEGTPLIRVDTATGEEEVVVELNPLSEEQLGLTLGGTYDVVMDPSGDRLYLGMNAGHGGEGEEASFGEVVLVVVDLA